MNPKQAIQVLDSAINAALLKGVYTLQDTAQILLALEAIHALTIQPIELEQD
jgi:ferric-dicitrate binding protein FerR (iron transport regulator)